MAAMAYLHAGNGGPVPPAGYLPIEEHGIVGDLRTVALVGTDGTVDWYCPSRFDAPSLFGALLDAMQRQRTLCVHRLAKDRNQAIQFGRFLANPAVTAQEMLTTAGRQTGNPAQARHIDLGASPATGP